MYDLSICFFIWWKNELVELDDWKLSGKIIWRSRKYVAWDIQFRFRARGIMLLGVNQKILTLLLDSTIVKSSQPPSHVLTPQLSIHVGTQLILQPKKVAKGREDAFFASTYNGGVIVVTDGVSGGIFVEFKSIAGQWSRSDLFLSLSQPAAAAAAARCLATSSLLTTFRFQEPEPIDWEYYRKGLSLPTNKPIDWKDVTILIKRHIETKATYKSLSSSSSRTTLSSVGIVSAPTFVSHVGTMGATSSTHSSSLPTSSNQSFLPTSSTQSFVPTSMQSSTPASTTSSVPTSTTNCSESVEEIVGVQHQEYLLGSTGLDGRLYIGVRDKELFPSGPCSSVIYESFGKRVDLNGYSWATLSDETKLLYWDEFHKKCYWDDAKTPLVQACWENKAKERYRQYIYNISSNGKNRLLKKPVNVTS
ncbi:unnamed protein product [Lactuca saligna]|uniref:Uncharacterized protein n=1 Tax=Lactuca saligna TaxID=75948 RepID=A0AA35VBA7_LACSI|nr:unnamed protein product [Lactuca saligna]